jgi:hypothetical protein
MIDHSWETTLDVDAVLGFTRPPRAYKIYAPDALAVAITGMVCALSVEHGSGRPIHLGPLWLRRCIERAENVQSQMDELD